MHINSIVRLCLAFSALLLPRLVTAAPPAGVFCGATLDPGTEWTMTGDLLCPGAGVTVNSAILHMNGHSITCQNDGNVGIAVIGANSLIEGEGEVVGCGPGITVGGEGHHTVDGVDVSNATADAGIAITSDKNVIVNSSSSSNWVDGIAVGGFKNKILDTQTTNNPRYGIGVDGDKNVVKGSTINGSSTGIMAAGTRVLLSGNSLSSNSGAIEVHGAGGKVKGNNLTGNVDGIIMTAEGKIVKNAVVGPGSGSACITAGGAYGLDIKIIKNTVSNSGAFDLVDAYADCGGHTWKKNEFGTANASCIE